MSMKKLQLIISICLFLLKFCPGTEHLPDEFANPFHS
jgi:hypothetical protein